MIGVLALVSAAAGASLAVAFTTNLGAGLMVAALLIPGAVLVAALCHAGRDN